MMIVVYHPAVYCALSLVIGLLITLFVGACMSTKADNSDVVSGLALAILVLMSLMWGMAQETKTDVQVATLALSRIGLAHPEYDANGKHLGMLLDIAERTEIDIQPEKTNGQN